MHEEKPTSPNKNPRRDSQRLSSVTTAVHLLKTFSEEEPELGISELAKRLKVAKSTVHRLASTLLNEGLLEQNPDNGRYALGFGLFALGSQVRSRLNVASVSKTYLHALRDQSGENVRLAILSGKSAVFVHDFESPESVRLRPITGQYRPTYATAEGICPLAGLRLSILEDYLSGPLEALTPNTVIDKDALLEKIRRVRRAGYAIEDEEFETGSRTIAAPVYQAEGSIIAAISLAGPRERIRKRAFPELADQVAQTALMISERLGYRAGQYANSTMI